jgi:hypothetical protein
MVLAETDSAGRPGNTGISERIEILPPKRPSTSSLLLFLHGVDQPLRILLRLAERYLCQTPQALALRAGAREF